MQKMKAQNVEIIMSEKFDSDLVGHFESSFHDNNFEFSMKSYIGADEFEGDSEDPRRIR